MYTFWKYRAFMFSSKLLHCKSEEGMPNLWLYNFFYQGLPKKKNLSPVLYTLLYLNPFPCSHLCCLLFNSHFQELLLANSLIPNFDEIFFLGSGQLFGGDDAEELDLRQRKTSRRSSRRSRGQTCQWILGKRRLNKSTKQKIIIRVLNNSFFSSSNGTLVATKQ